MGNILKYLTFLTSVFVLVFDGCDRIEPSPEPADPVSGLVADTNDVRETWTCDTEDFSVTLKFLTQGGLVYSSVNQNSSLNYHLFFADTTFYKYQMEGDTIMRLTQEWYEGASMNINSPFVMHRVALDTVELRYIGYVAEPPFILEYYKFHIVSRDAKFCASTTCH